MRKNYNSRFSFFFCISRSFCIGRGHVNITELNVIFSFELKAVCELKNYNFIMNTSLYVMEMGRTERLNYCMQSASIETVLTLCRY